MDGYDGPTLRSVRESQNVALRKVARMANMSHGHLSKVERGEPGRPVTPAVLSAYERACGVRLTGMAGHDTGDAGGGDWRRGHLSEARRRTLNAKIAAVAIGGPLGEQITRILDSTGRILAPLQVDEADVAAVEAAAAMCTGLDLRLGGGVCDQQARALLRWAVGLLGAQASDPVGARLHSAIGWLGQRAGWAAFDADSHDVARSLLTIALYAAARADDADLRAHVLADLAAQHNYLGYPQDCLQVVRLGEVDERVSPPVRMVVSGVKARAYAALGETEACWHHVGLAEAAHAAAAAEHGSPPSTTCTAAAAGRGWTATVATLPQMLSTTGHALATLARRTSSGEAREQAQERLGKAVDQFGPGNTRAAGLCMAQLASLHLQVDEQPQAGLAWAQRALDTATGVRSMRLVGHLTVVRDSLAAHPAAGSGQAAVADLLAGIDAASGVEPVLELAGSR